MVKLNSFHEKAGSSQCEFGETSEKSASGKLSGFIPVESAAHLETGKTARQQVIATNLRAGFVTGSK